MGETATAAIGCPPPTVNAHQVQQAQPGGPLSESDRQQLALASGKMRKIRRAASIARISGWSMACFAGLTVLLGLLSLPSLVTGGALAVIAWNELASASRLERLDPRAASRLAWNQVLLLVLLTLYCAWKISDAFYGVNPYTEIVAQGGPAADTIRPIANMISTVTALAYGLLIVASLFAQGGLAMYYASRRRHILAYLHNTPRWIVQTQQQAMLI